MIEDIQLPAYRVRLLVACPICKAERSRPCVSVPQRGTRGNHWERGAEARALVRELRLGLVRPT